MADTYRVICPYATLKVKDRDGAHVVAGFYEGAIVSDPVDPAAVKSLVERGYLEKVSAEQVSASEPEPPADPVAGPSADEAPARNASKADWVDWAESQGADRADAEASTRDELADRYGDS